MAAGGIMLGAFLEKNNSLELLHVSFNQLGEVGGNAIARALEKNVTLQKLDISFNKLTPAVVKKFKEFLSLNVVGHNVQELNIEEQDLSPTLPIMQVYIFVY